MPDLMTPDLKYETFTPTRDSLQLIAQLVSDIKGRLFPHQKNWEEFSLDICANGFTSTAIPIETSSGLELLELGINLNEHKLFIYYKNKQSELTFDQKTYNTLTEELLTMLKSFDIGFDKIDEKFYNLEKIIYIPDEAEKLWVLLKQIYSVLLEFRGSTLFETSNINFWAHHFDLALLLFSGKIIDGQDKADWDYSREQMNFGFSLGDEGIMRPYFYITMYPFKEYILDKKLPDYAYWHTEGWKGVVVELNKLSVLQDNKTLLLKLFNDLVRINYK